MMVPPAELRQHFAPDGVLLAETAEVTLGEGPFHQGPAAVVQIVWRRSATPPQPSSADG